jgi:hypothetical protein
MGGRPRLAIVSSDRVGKETNHVNRQLSSGTRLAATALLVGIAVMACGKPSDSTTGQPAGPTPTVQQSQAGQAAATLAPSPMDATTESAAPSEAPTNSAAPAASSAAATTVAGATAGDPLDAQFSNLDNLLNGVNGSLSGSETSGGE